VEQKNKTTFEYNFSMKWSKISKKMQQNKQLIIDKMKKTFQKSHLIEFSGNL
jgi:hypothetical protein